MFNSSPAIAKISQFLSSITTTSSPAVPSTSVFDDWLRDAVLHNEYAFLYNFVIQSLTEGVKTPSSTSFYDLHCRSHNIAEVTV
jgi:hypothetical protein